MGRPAKSAKVLTDSSQTKDEITQRIDEEEKLKGKSDKLITPKKLTENQLKIFNYIVEELEEAKLLGNLDIFILTNTVIAIDRLETIEYKINENPKLQFRKELQNSKKIYSTEFFKGCNELSLSPQSRAKLSNINMQGKAASQDKVLLALLDD